VDGTTNGNGYVRGLTFEGLKHKSIGEEVIVECHENDIGVNAWVVDKIGDIERMKELGVDIISSDYPDRI
jgi:glycerophosphoryl diester phosphodiesterase